MPKKPETMDRARYGFERLFMSGWTERPDLDELAPWLKTIIRPEDIPAIAHAAGVGIEEADHATIATELSDAFYRAANFAPVMSEASLPPSELTKFGNDVATATARLQSILGYDQPIPNFERTAKLNRLFSGPDEVPINDLSFVTKALPGEIRTAILEASMPAIGKVPDERRVATAIINIAPVALELLRLHAHALASSYARHPSVAPGNRANTFSAVLYANLAQIWLAHFGSEKHIAKSKTDKEAADYPSNCWLTALFATVLDHVPPYDSLDEVAKAAVDAIHRETELAVVSKANNLHQGLTELTTGERHRQKRNRNRK